MDNPFRYGDVATGATFANRVQELAEIEADVRNGQNVVIISPRRYGKTSLILKAVEHLKQDKVLVAYLDLFRTPTKDRFADHLARAIHAGLVAPLERAWKRALDLFQQLPIRPRITVGQDGSPSFEFTAGERSRDLDRTIEELLAIPGRIALERRRRVALILDEFQEVVAIDPHLPALMRAVFQNQGEVSHVFLGSKRHLMQQVFTDRNEPMYKLAKPLPLHPIGQEDFGTFIQDRFTNTRRPISAEAIRHLLEISACHPHDTQELCYFTWALAQAQDIEVTPDVVDHALARIVEAENARYTTLWEELSAHQRLVLTALATAGGEAIYSQEYRRLHRLGAASTVQRSLERLLERELVELTAPAAYSVPDVFLRAWIADLQGPP